MKTTRTELLAKLEQLRVVAAAVVKDCKPGGSLTTADESGVRTVRYSLVNKALIASLRKAIKEAK